MGFRLPWSSGRPQSSDQWLVFWFAPVPSVRFSTCPRGAHGQPFGYRCRSRGSSSAEVPIRGLGLSVRCQGIGRWSRPLSAPAARVCSRSAETRERAQPYSAELAQQVAGPIEQRLWMGCRGRPLVATVELSVQWQPRHGAAEIPRPRPWVRPAPSRLSHSAGLQSSLRHPVSRPKQPPRCWNHPEQSPRVLPG